MKKLSIVVLAAMALVSCGNTYTAKDVELTDQTDSVNYALGLINGLQLKNYQLPNDSSDETVAEFIDALQAGYDGKDEELSEVAQMGQNIGTAMKASEKTGLADNAAWTLNEEMFFQGLVNGINGEASVLNIDQAREFFQTAYSRQDVKAGKPVTAKCPKKAKVVELKDFADTLNYAFGLLNGDQIKMYVLNNDSDGTMVDELVENINKGLKSKIKNPQLVNMGKQIGKSIKEQEGDGLLGVHGLETRFDLIKQGFINGLYLYEDQMSGEEAGKYVETVINNLKYGEVKAAGEKFLAENALREGVIVTESGLQYEVIKMGNGAKPAATDRVKVHYHGTLTDGTVFDSSVERGEPIVFGLNQVIPGWTEGLQLMPVGSKFRFYIPQELGYGSREAGKIPPYSVLIFDVELLGIEK